MIYFVSPYDLLNYKTKSSIPMTIEGMLMTRIFQPLHCVSVWLFISVFLSLSVFFYVWSVFSLAIDNLERFLFLMLFDRVNVEVMHVIRFIFVIGSVQINIDFIKLIDY